MKIEIYSKISRMVAYLTTIFLMFTASLNAQERDTTNHDNGIDILKPGDCVPEFPGGTEALRKFISDNLEYPDGYYDTGGKVIVSFVVERDGSVYDEKIVTSLSAPFDSAAINVVRKMPRWIPCSARFRPLRLRNTVPIVFQSKRNDVQTENDTIIYKTEPLPIPLLFAP